MTTWYIDPANGTDSNSSAGNGDSFATRRKSLTNLTAASLVAGDTVKFIKSSNATSLGINGTWTKGPIPSSVSITSSTNATPIVITLSSGNYTTLNPSAGDTVVIASHTTNTKANGVWKISAVNGSTTVTIVNADGTNSVGNGVGGATGTITKINASTVKLASPLVQNIACHGNRGALTNWTASANVTCTIDSTNYKEGGESQTIAIGASFTTGKAAYLTLSTLDLSAYKQVSFWLRWNSGTALVSGDMELRLCSDTTGDTVVNTIAIPPLQSNAAWACITVDKAAALGSAIQSISLYVNVDRGAQSLNLDCITACKDSTSNDSLSLSSLIGKSSGNYYGIQSINYDRVILDTHVNAKPIVGQITGYYGTSETVTTYKRECFKYAAALGLTTQVMNFNDSGTSGSPITISGGWNDTDMTTQTGETWFDGINGNGYLFYGNNISYWSGFGNLAAVRYYAPAYFGSASNVTASFRALNNNTLYGINATSAQNVTLGADYIENNLSGVLSGIINTITAGQVNNNVNYGVLVQQGSCKFNLDSCCNNLSYGAYINTNVGGDAVLNIDLCKDNGTSNYNFDTVGGCVINNSVMGGSAPIDITLTTMYGYDVIANRCTFAAATEVSVTATYIDSRLYVNSRNLDNNDHRIYLPNANIKTDTGVVYGTNPYSWKLSPTSTTYQNENNPTVFSLGKFTCYANVATTFKAQFRRTNTGISAQLVCEGGQINGVDNDVTESMTAAQDTWEELSISFTPTETKTVEILAKAWGGTTYSVYVDDWYQTSGTISGNITESLDITDWMVTAYKCSNGEYNGHTYTNGTNYSINVLHLEPSHITLSPRIHYRWSASKVSTLNDFVVATVPDTTPHIWKCTTAGTTGGSEPTWNLSGTTTDNTTTWTYIAPLVDPKTLGPKIPVAL